MAQTDGLFAEIGHFRLIWAIAGEAEEPHQHCTHTPYIVSNLLRGTMCRCTVCSSGCRVSKQVTRQHNSLALYDLFLHLRQRALKRLHLGSNSQTPRLS